MTRFLWVKDRGHIRFDNSNIQEYRFCRVPFGVISSPFLLGATVETHLELYGSEVAMKLKDDIYVDNVITGTNSIEDAVHLYREAKLIFRKASMNLREWVSNHSQVNQIIEKEDMAICESTKVLGHTWTIESDTISLKRSNSQLEQTQLTKRNVLKEIASVFDPLGLFSPVLLRGKLFLQTLWNKRLQWDDVICSEDLAVWLTISSDLSKLPECSIKRNIALIPRKQAVIYIVCFCDASACAYATTVYLHQSINDSESKADIIFSKTRLAPLKKMTIPRLELMAVVIGVRCTKFVKDQLKLPIKTTYIWTDSQCVLKWINSDKDLSVFVKNRVKEIKSHDGIVFGFVSSRENPADIASRGSNIQTLRENHLWWHGPTWLRSTEWPESTEELDEETKQDYESELKKGVSVKESTLLQVPDNISDISTYSTGSCAPFDIDCDRYSTVTKVVRVTAYVLRFIKMIRKSVGVNQVKTDRNSKYLTNNELTEAENLWLLYIQRKHFPEVFTAITSNKTNNLQRQLGIYLDNNGILRCKGRIENANLSEAARHPILLPKK